MDHTLGVKITDCNRVKPSSLNPCFSGPYSRSIELGEQSKAVQEVLILVLVDHTLGELIVSTFV